ncbi:MAG: hypothetical protein IPO83_08105 [Chitinophagaceae bacterium]|nr:hypothetical protein [Chitinophagaceae bacterium]
MKGLTNNLHAKVSLLLGLIGLLGLLTLNFYLASVYVNADGKTQALFGIIELENEIYKYIIGIGVTIAIVMDIIAYFKKESGNWIMAAMVTCLITFICIFLSIWKAMI